MTVKKYKEVEVKLVLKPISCCCQKYNASIGVMTASHRHWHRLSCDQLSLMSIEERLKPILRNGLDTLSLQVQV